MFVPSAGGGTGAYVLLRRELVRAELEQCWGGTQAARYLVVCGVASFTVVSGFSHQVTVAI